MNKKLYKKFLSLFNVIALAFSLTIATSTTSSASDTFVETCDGTNKDVTVDLSQYTLPLNLSFTNCNFFYLFDTNGVYLFSSWSSTDPNNQYKGIVSSPNYENIVPNFVGEITMDTGGLAYFAEPVQSFTVNGPGAIWIYVPGSYRYTFTYPDSNITSNAGSGGSISPNGNTTVGYGANQNYVITPDVGYTISDVLVDGTSIGPVSNYTFSNVSTNHTISATFTPITFSISSSAGLGGTISPSGVTTVNYGSSQSYLITPNSGYAISNVLVDGISVGAVSSFLFSGVVGNRSISAIFSQIQATNGRQSTSGSCNSNSSKASNKSQGGGANKNANAFCFATSGPSK
jgi:hypothetical protein